MAVSAPGTEAPALSADIAHAPWLVYCDGSAVPNPGRIGLGAVFTEPNETRHTLSQAAQEKGCNNEAELRALLAALHELKLRGADALLIHCDSSVVVEQVGSGTAKPIARLAPLIDQARALLHSFDQATLVWIPRHRNTEADALARAALGMAERRVAKIAGKRR
ncbi:ribonuclease H [Acidovorax sp. SRB_14]|uniref:ribonuclease HI family protein n=1 Tax=Acidovorax sp. SRB_14 TaxID=1962699 RepID=UPI001563A229|nr:ribonuclease HI family protein [Acidovorax sp. SRB_14]NMM80435.1 ribonuclease H [Acidovorax sp. SRB_14]